MPVYKVSGDPLLTRAQTLAFAHNLQARVEVGRLETAILDRYPAANAAYRKQCRAKALRAGEYWMWRESAPMLSFMVVRESAVGATRLRYVQSVMLKLARDYRLEGLTSLAIAPLGTALEWADIRNVIDTWLRRTMLPVIVYEVYLPGVQAEEPLP